MGAQLRAPVMHPSVDPRPPRVNCQLGGRRGWDARAATKLAPVSCSAVLGGMRLLSDNLSRNRVYDVRLAIQGVKLKTSW